jgi:excisionase family DNA binding protein
MRSKRAPSPPPEDVAPIRRELARLTDQVEALREMLAELIRAQAPAEELLDQAEAAALLRVCSKTLSSMVRREGLPCVKVGQQNRYRRADLLAWLEERAARPRAQGARHGETLRLASGGK